MRMNKKTMLLIIPAIALLACCIAAICVICIPSSYEVYTKQIQTAEKYLADKDYDGAIKYYEMAKAADETQEEPYLKLAMIYYENKNDMEKAVAILNEGYEKTKSEQIKNALAVYLGSAEGTTVSSGKTDYNSNPVNITLLNMFGQYNYEQYGKNYTVVSDNYSDGVYTVRYNGIDAEFSYNNDATKVVDEKAMKPFSYSFPTEIKVDKISDIINLPSQGMKIDELKKSAGITNAVAKYDNTLKKNIITFSCEKCTVSVETDKNGTILADSSYLSIKPDTVVSSNQKFTVTGTVTGKTSLQPVATGKISVRKGNGVKSGSSVAESAIENGAYSLSLESGDYSFEVSAAGYTTEYFDVTVGNSNLTKDFALEAKAGAVKIVLEWSDSSTYVTSHAYCDGNNGMAYGEVGHYEAFQGDTLEKNGTKIAEYSRDESAKTETMTWYNTDGILTYHVHSDYAASDVKVKVYMPGSSTPIVITNPSGSGNGSYWTAFEIRNGELQQIDGATN